MKIRNLQLYHFRGFEDLQMQFPKDAQCLVFIGENGSGKTSLLEGISMILQDALYKYHSAGAVDWNNPLNVHSAHLYGTISIGIQGPKRSYDFSQSLSADRNRFISEDRLALRLKRDLTEEDRMEHYKTHANMAFDAKRYDKAMEYYLTLAKIQEKALGIESIDLADTYHEIGRCYAYTENLEEALNYTQNSIKIRENVLASDDISLARSYYNMSLFFSKLEKYKESLAYQQKSLVIREKKLGVESLVVAESYYVMADNYSDLKDYKKSLEYYEKALSIRIIVLNPDDIRLSDIYHNIGFCYHILKTPKLAIDYYQKSLEIAEKITEYNHTTLLQLYNNLSIAYTELGNNEDAAYYEEKAKGVGTEEPEIKEFIPALYLNNDKDSLEHFNEYLETWMPVVLHYSARQAAVNEYKDAFPLAFRIPMTTDFDLVSDWFIEHENDENRKRLRVDVGYQSAELTAIRTVITKGLTLLNGEDNIHFTDLQTEIDETVVDGQVASWLSIKKDGLALNVGQLSDGEKRVLVLLMDITRRLISAGKRNKLADYLTGAGIVLIDEIEQHLHPKWQRTLLPTLMELFPNLQFVVTTHSPQVLSYVPNGCAFTLENSKAFPQNTYGRNNEWILEAIMDDEPRPKEVQAQLNQYFDLIREDKMEEAAAMRKKLEASIGTDEPELLKADILIRRKQKSAAKHEAN